MRGPRRDLRRRQPLRRVHLLKLVFSRLQLLLAGFTCGLELLLTGLELLLTSFKPVSYKHLTLPTTPYV